MEVMVEESAQVSSSKSISRRGCITYAIGKPGLAGSCRCVRWCSFFWGVPPVYTFVKANALPFKARPTNRRVGFGRAHQETHFPIPNIFFVERDREHRFWSLLSKHFHNFFLEFSRNLLRLKFIDLFFFPFPLKFRCLLGGYVQFSHFSVFKDI